MQVPTELTFHGLDHSDPAQAAVERWVARLEYLHARLLKCEVAIDQPHRELRVRVRLTVLGTELDAKAESEDIYLAIADAFRAAHCQLRATRRLSRELRPVVTL